MTRYWVRDSRKLVFGEPLAFEHISAAVRTRRIPANAEMLEASGQSVSDLMGAVGWEPISIVLQRRAAADEAARAAAAAEKAGSASEKSDSSRWKLRQGNREISMSGVSDILKLAKS